MATTVYARYYAGGDGATPGIHTGTNNVKLNGSTSGWSPMLLHTTRGAVASGQALSTNTVAGPTNGVEVVAGLGSVEWISLPVDQNVTISGTITFNIWAAESAAQANTAINCIIQRLDSTGAIVSTIVQTARVIELGTSAAAANFTATPTSTNMLKGDRFRVRIYGDDATGVNMGSGRTFTVYVAGNTGGAQGDTFITFNETFGFQTSDPSTTTMYLTDVTGPAIGANIEKELWTSRGDGINTVVTSTAGGWTAPIQCTDTAGGTAVEWYSKRVNAFTLGGIVKVVLTRASESNLGAECSVRAELATCNDDGSNVTVWAGSSFISSSSLGGTVNSGTDANGELTAGAAVTGYLAGADLSVTGGQRLRLRLFIDDQAVNPMTGSLTATVEYDATSGGANGDSFIILGQSVTEFSVAMRWKDRAPAHRSNYNNSSYY